MADAIVGASARMATSLPARRTALSASSLLLVFFAACGGGDSAQPDAGGDAAVDAMIDGAGGFTTCQGTCRMTAATAMFAANRMLDRAYYGVTASTQKLHVEAYRNAPAGCPTMTSPNPDYTLILGGVPIPTSMAQSTSPGNILDFKGDLLGGPLGAQATMVTITPVAADAVTSMQGFVALDVMLTFANGSVSGHLYATHCISLDAP